MQPDAPYVILRHVRNPGDIHYDLLLEQDGTLLAWRLERAPDLAPGGELAALRLPDHRLRYLTFVGEVGRGLGRVTRFDTGTWQVEDRTDGVLGLNLEGKALRGAYRLVQVQDDRWLFRRSDSQAPAARAMAVLFDMDGVLVSSYRIWFHLLNEAARDLDYPAISEEAFRGTWGQGPAADVEHFFTRHTVAQIEAYYQANFGRHLEQVQVESDAAQTLTALHQRGIRTAVVTNTPTPLAQEILRFAGLAPQHLVGSGDVPQDKPAPDMVLRALALTGVQPEAAWMVGDSRYDREAAAAARVLFAGFRTDGAVRLERLTDLLPLVDDAG